MVNAEHCPIGSAAPVTKTYSGASAHHPLSGRLPVLGARPLRSRINPRHTGLERGESRPSPPHRPPALPAVRTELAAVRGNNWQDAPTSANRIVHDPQVVYAASSTFSRNISRERGTPLAFERSYTHSRRCDNLEVLAVLMEELLESFVAAGLGLTLVSRIREASQLPEVQVRPTKDPPDIARVCAAWHTDLGRVIICATYHPEHSRRVKSHVLWLEWWTPSQVHHQGWWHCEPKWPRDWVKAPVHRARRSLRCRTDGQRFLGGWRVQGAPPD
jgi:hypothetical protein